MLLFVFLEVIIAFLFSLFRFPPTKSHSLQEPLSAVFSAGKHIILFSPLTSSSIREWWFSQSVAQLTSWVFPLLSSREFSLLLSLISGITDRSLVFLCLGFLPSFNNGDKNHLNTIKFTRQCVLGAYFLSSYASKYFLNFVHHTLIFQLSIKILLNLAILPLSSQILTWYILCLLF